MKAGGGWRQRRRRQQQQSHCSAGGGSSASVSISSGAAAAPATGRQQWQAASAQPGQDVALACESVPGDSTDRPPHPTMPSATLSDALPPALRYVIPGVVLRPPADGGSRPQWWQFSLELVPGWPQLLATCCLAGLYRDWAALALAVALWGVLVAEVRSNSFDAQLASLALAAVSKSGAGPGPQPPLLTASIWYTAGSPSSQQPQRASDHPTLGPSQPFGDVFHTRNYSPRDGASGLASWRVTASGLRCLRGHRPARMGGRRAHAACQWRVGRRPGPRPR